MARNEEKSQSMLFRFRESQAAELGLASRTDTRPRVASSCQDLRSCEKWRGEILKLISRKVSKIQDFGLTDYEVRDCNDEINKLLREKHHWENQIIHLGGANYKRAGKSLDADGKEVPGARGYKYFGRARELPGVKELFQSAAAESAEIESYKTQRVDKFSQVGPGYFGELDEEDAELLAFERAAEVEAWEEAIESLLDDHSLSISTHPSLPLPSYISLTAPPTPLETPSDSTPGSKRKAASATKAASAKKAKLDAKVLQESKKSGGGFESVLREEDLRPPVLMSPKEIEDYVISEQKKALLAQYDA